LRGLLPHLGLIASGGHTILFSIDNDRSINPISSTRDDAAGEALDKGAKLLGLPYPGGPLVEQLAASGNARAFDFPRALGEGSNRASTPFSFSGLKTSLRYRLEKMSATEIESARADLCASYQAAVVDQLIAKTEWALRANLENGAPVRSVGLSGGVANNRSLRAAFSNLAAQNNLPCLIAEPRHTGDNAAMIAFAAWADSSHTTASTPTHPLSFEPALPLN
jgi:N6-L-threonylcarbamoyladenine synthase